MSAITGEYLQPVGGQQEPLSVADLQERLIDWPNSDQEARQMSKIENYSLRHAGKKFNLTTFRPTDGLRTWPNANGEPVQYPELLMVHGVASDERYFWSLFEKMNKLGIACSAIELPRERGVVHDPDALLDWQSGAVVTARKFIEEKHDNTNIVIGGQSRGCYVSVLGAEKIAELEGEDAITGLLLLAPPMEPKGTKELAVNLASLAFNSFRYSRNLRLLGREAMMILEIVGRNPVQTIIETHQALNMNATDILYETLGSVPTFIPAAENDEFIDHTALFRHVINAPHGNIAMVTLNTNHMLGERDQVDITSSGDPRLLSGQILAWLRSLAVDYRPLAVNPATQAIARIE